MYSMFVLGMFVIGNDWFYPKELHKTLSKRKINKTPHTYVCMYVCMLTPLAPPFFAVYVVFFVDRFG